MTFLTFATFIKNIFTQLNIDFPNLTHLELKAADLFTIEDSLNIINLPKLTHFGIDSFEPCEISELIESYNFPHTGIKSLSLHSTHYAGSVDQVEPTAAAKLVYLFPAVNEFKFDLELRIDTSKEPDMDCAILREMMRSLSGWKLTQWKVIVTYNFYSKAMINSFGGFPLYDDLKSGIVVAILEGMADWKGWHWKFLGKYFLFKFH